MAKIGVDLTKIEERRGGGRRKRKPHTRQNPPAGWEKHAGKWPPKNFGTLMTCPRCLHHKGRRCEQRDRRCTCRTIPIQETPANWSAIRAAELAIHHSLTKGMDKAHSDKMKHIIVCCDCGLPSIKSRWLLKTAPSGHDPHGRKEVWRDDVGAIPDADQQRLLDRADGINTPPESLKPTKPEKKFKPEPQ